MAKENFVYLHGQIYDKPRIYINGNGIAKKAAFAVKVLRRPQAKGEGAVTMGKLSIDIPTIMTMDESLIKICQDLHKGDMVDIKGIYTTREVKKTSICPHGHQMTWAGNCVFITPIYICPRENELSDDNGLLLLKQRAEVSNIVMLIGTLCRDPELREFEGANGRKSKVCQYQVASNRRYHIRDGIHDERTDYPWVKTAGKQAVEDAERLRTGSVVYINGAIQTREIDRTLTCPECGEQFSIKEGVSEIYPYAVEYLQNCIFKEKEKEKDDAPAPQSEDKTSDTTAS